jgi:Protein of unknown function (DUF3300)
MDKKKKPSKFATTLLSSAACLLIGLTPEYSFAVEASPPENPTSETSQTAPEAAQPEAAPSPTAPHAAESAQPAPAAAEPAAPAAPAAPAQETTAPPPRPTNPAPVTKFTQAQLEQMLAPIALYPDSLLAQVLPASAYPIQIVQAERWLEKKR